MVNHSYNTIATNKIQMPSQIPVVSTKVLSYSKGKSHTCSPARYLSQCCSTVTAWGSHTQRRATSTNSPLIWPWEGNRFSKQENSISRGPAARLIIREGEKKQKSTTAAGANPYPKYTQSRCFDGVGKSRGYWRIKRKENAELSVP